MNITKEFTRLENSSVKLAVSVSQQDVADCYKKELSDLAKNIQLPGYRKGHVPLNLIEQKYGKELQAEAVGRIIDDAFNEILQDDASKDYRPLPYSQPRLEDDKLPEFDSTKDLSFALLYDVFPSVEVKNFSGITIKEPQVEITDKDVQEELDSIRDRNSTIIDKKEGEGVAKDNIVTINYSELDDSDAVIEGTEREGFVFTVGSGENIYKIDDEITGMKKDETKTITKKYDKKDPDEDLAGKTKKIRVTVTAIKEKILPELDDDLAQDVSEKYKTLDDLKNDIKKQMLFARDDKIAEIKSQSLLEQLVEKNPFDLPLSMIQAEKDARWDMIAQQFRTTPEELDKLVLSSGQSKEDMIKQWTGDTEKMLKSRIIVDRLLSERNISLTPEEIDAEYQKLADVQGVDVEEIKNHYKDPKALEYLVDDTKEHKLFDELYKEVKVSKGDKLTFADLFKADEQ